MTRAEIRAKYGIVVLEPPRVANKDDGSDDPD